MVNKILICLLLFILSINCGDRNTNKLKSQPGSEVLFQIQKGKKFGYIDDSGRVIVKPKYDLVEDFSDGMAAVGQGKNWSSMKWGYINAMGEQVLECRFDRAFDFSEGLAPVEIEGKWGFIDKKGNMVIKQKFEYANEFHEGLARVTVSENSNDSWGFIDTEGGFVIQPMEGRSYHTHFSEGLVGVEIDEKWGYIDRTGNLVIEPKFDKCEPFSEGLAYVTLSNIRGFINQEGKMVIKLPIGWEAWSGEGRFKEGLVLISTGSGFIYINQEGRIKIMVPQFQWARNFSDSLAVVDYGIDFEGFDDFLKTGIPSNGKVKIGKCGYINKEGNVIIEPRFVTQSCGDFVNGLANVELGGKRYAYITKEGKVTYTYEQENISDIYK